MADTSSLAERRQVVGEEIASRVERGLRLFEARGAEITADERGFWGVPSCTFPGMRYRVRLSDNGAGIFQEERCECADFSFHGSELGLDKHTVAARMARAYRRGVAAERRERRFFELLITLSRPVSADETLTGSYDLACECAAFYHPDRDARELIGWAGAQRHRAVLSARAKLRERMSSWEGVAS